MTPFLNVTGPLKRNRAAWKQSKRVRATKKPSECVVTYVMPPKPETVVADIQRLEAVLATINERQAKLETE